VGGESRVVPVGTIVRDVLNGIPSRDLVAARVEGKVVDLTRKLEHDAAVEPVLADSPEGLEVIRHSTAHLMAMAVQSLYPGTQVTIGPVIEDRPQNPADRNRARGRHPQILGDGRKVQGRDNPGHP